MYHPVYRKTCMLKIKCVNYFRCNDPYLCRLESFLSIFYFPDIAFSCPQLCTDSQADTGSPPKTGSWWWLIYERIQQVWFHCQGHHSLPLNVKVFTSAHYIKILSKSVLHQGLPSGSLYLAQDAFGG